MQIQSKPILRGIPASVGCVTGTVRLVSGMADVASFQDGDILVTRLCHRVG